MKKVTILLLLLSACFTSQIFAQTSTEGIKWVSITEAERLSNEHPKKILIDIYTDWCGWCKRLDATTYKNPEIVKYINDNYYAVKLNAESKDKIMYGGQEYSYDPARRINAVSSNFMSPQGGYPTTTFLDEKKQVISMVPGYMAADMMSNVLRYFAENHYLNTDWNAYLSSLSNSNAPKQ